MFFPGLPVRILDENINQEDVDSLLCTLETEFSHLWKQRSLNLMSESYCLKAITPMNIDRLNHEDENKLKQILLPWVEPFVPENHSIVYLDVSSLPPGAKSLVHVDNTVMHMLSKRIRIPLSTNEKSFFVLKTYEGIFNFNLKVGKVYETNNQCIHYAHNKGESNRWHIVADIMHTSVYNSLVESGLITAYGLDPSVNFCFNTSLITALETALENMPPEEI